MRISSVLLWAACAFVFSCASAADAQVDPAAQRSFHALSFGTGVTTWNPDVGSGHMLGITAWANDRLLIRHFDGLGIDVEGRIVNWNRSSSQPSNLRQTTIGGGPMYTWDRFQKVQPYAKFLFAFGAMNFAQPGSTYGHDTRTVYAPGGGLQVRAYRNLRVRLDYEYQIWQPMLLPNGGRPTPEGFTLGLAWDLRTSRER